MYNLYPELYKAMYRTKSRGFKTYKEYISNAFLQEISQINIQWMDSKVSHSRFQQIIGMTNWDPVLQTIKTIILNGWNDR